MSCTFKSNDIAKKKTDISDKIFISNLKNYTNQNNHIQGTNPKIQKDPNSDEQTQGPQLHLKARSEALLEIETNDTAEKKTERGIYNSDEA